MKAEKISVVISAFIIILLGALIIWKLDVIGVSEGRLEQAARKGQDIDSDWQMVQDINGDMCVMLFYDEAKSDCRYSVYLAREGMSCGYFYVDGGVDGFMINGSRSMIYDDRGIALLSMNKDRVCRIEVERGTEGTIEVAPVKPFALLLPANCGEITMYDTQGNLVTLYDAFVG